MNQGFLRMMVIQQLSEKSLSGYNLVKTIKEQTGWKPSYGSMYPLLERLEQDNVVSVKKQGRSKLYSLTANGREKYRAEREAKHEALSGIIEQLKVLASLGDEEAGAMANVIDIYKKEGIPFKELPEVIEMRGEMFRLVKEGKTRTHRKHISRIVSRTTRELKKI